MRAAHPDPDGEPRLRALRDALAIRISADLELLESLGGDPGPDEPGAAWPSADLLEDGGCA